MATNNCISTRNVLLQTAVAFVADLANFADPNAWSLHRTEDAVHSNFPVSLGAGMNQSNAAMIQFRSSILPNPSIWNWFDSTDMPSVVDTEQCIVVLHRELTARTDFGPYPNEFMFIMQMTSSGTLIERSWEMIDSNSTNNYIRSIPRGV